MNERRTLVLGTRGSDLALKQASMVEEALRAKFPDLVVERKVIATTGDRRTDVPLAAVAKAEGIMDKGIFLKEIEQALRDGEIDFAVHSLKDMPSELDDAFELRAVLPRACVQDVLVSRKPAEECSVIATGSVRRRFMARRHFGDAVRFSDLRGNVPTRLKKLAASAEMDAIILAKAGLDRLGLFAESKDIDGARLYMSVLPVDSFIPAAGQGIVGIEIRKGDSTVTGILDEINHARSFICARAERTFLCLLGANCSTPVGVHACLTDEGDLRLSIALYQENEEDSAPYTDTMTGSAQAPEELARKAWERLQETGFSSMNHQE